MCDTDIELNPVYTVAMFTYRGHVLMLYLMVSVEPLLEYIIGMSLCCSLGDIGEAEWDPGVAPG